MECHFSTMCLVCAFAARLSLDFEVVLLLKGAGMFFRINSNGMNVLFATVLAGSSWMLSDNAAT